jgi:hypothetical protein
MAVLFFSGEEVAFFGGINDTGSASEFTDVVAPFEPEDVVEIEISDDSIGANGEFDHSEVIFLRVTVVRDGVRYDFDVDSGSKIKEGGGKEQGDSFFTTNDSVGPPPSGPFAGLETEKMVFAIDSVFTTGETTTIERNQDRDVNDDGDTADSGETGDENFNVSQSTAPPCFAAQTLIATPSGALRAGDLGPGAMVTLAGGGAASVRLVLRRTRRFGRGPHPHKPIEIKAGAFGPGVPSARLVLSPQHRVALTGPLVRKLAGQDAVLARCKAMTERPGCRVMRGARAVTYVSLMLDRHDVVLAEGLPVESY